MVQSAHKIHELSPAGFVQPYRTKLLMTSRASVYGSMVHHSLTIRWAGAGLGQVSISARNTVCPRSWLLTWRSLWGKTRLPKGVFPTVILFFVAWNALRFIAEVGFISSCLIDIPGPWLHRTLLGLSELSSWRGHVRYRWTASFSFFFTAVFS